LKLFHQQWSFSCTHHHHHHHEQQQQHPKSKQTRTQKPTQDHRAADGEQTEDSSKVDQGCCSADHHHLILDPQ